jgi:DNA-binding winged helix-turn-helix (wHTH) protein
MVKAMGRPKRADARGGIAFAQYRLDVQEGCLWKGKRRIPLSTTDSAILTYLVSRAGRLVTRDELLAALWRSVAVTPGVVKVRVRRLRRALGDDVKRPRFIETVHGRGYRFIASVSDPPCVPPEAQADMLRHLCRAARNALRRRAPHEAITMARKALPLMSSITGAGERAAVEQELRVMIGRLELVRRESDAPEVADNTARLRALCDERPDDPSCLPALVALARFELHRGEIRTAYAISMRVHRLAARCRDRDLAGAHTLLAAAEFNAGRLVSADQHLTRALSLYDSAQSQALGTAYGENIEVPLHAYRALVLWHLGSPQRALGASRAALASARRLGLPAPMAFALGMAAWLHRLRGEADAAGRVATRLRDLATAEGFPFWRAQATFELGWVAAARGHTDEGRALMQEGLQRYRATGARLYDVGDRVVLLERWPGAIAEHAAAIDELLTSVARTGQLCHESTLHRLKAESLLQRGDVDAAKASFECAIAVAAAQGARPLEHHARAGLSRLSTRRLVRR